LRVSDHLSVGVEGVGKPAKGGTSTRIFLDWFRKDLLKPLLAVLPDVSTSSLAASLLSLVVVVVARSRFFFTVSVDRVSSFGLDCDGASDLVLLSDVFVLLSDVFVLLSDAFSASIGMLAPSSFLLSTLSFQGPASFLRSTASSVVLGPARLGSP
jgi:hypothetical protein